MGNIFEEGDHLEDRRRYEDNIEVGTYRNGFYVT
jgi:hypothetical protein